MVCAAALKQAALAAMQDDIQAALRRDGGTTFALPEQDIPVAVAWGLFQPMMAPPLGSGMMPFPVPLCWSHLLGISLQESALMPATPAMMPGTGPGGAVMLDRR